MSTIKYTVPTQKRIVHLSTVTSYIKWSQISKQGQSRKKKKSLRSFGRKTDGNRQFKRERLIWRDDLRYQEFQKLILTTFTRRKHPGFTFMHAS